MNPSFATQLLAALTAEYAALVNFVALLEREQGMLLDNLTDQLFELSEQKTTDALGLNGLSKTSRNLLPKDISELNVDSIHAWLGTHSPECVAVWQQVIGLAKRTQQLNRTNGELIQMRLRHNQQSLAVLANAVNKANLYGPDGQPNFAPGSGRSLGSG